MRALLLLLPLALTVYALIDCAQTPRTELRGPSKGGWVAIVLLLPVVGPLAWLLAGRVPPGAAGEPARPAPLAPDDDPEFLARLRRRLGPDDPRGGGRPGG